MNDVDAFNDYISTSQSILIVGHKYPDTDSIGSCMALAHVLQKGRDVKVWIPKETVPETEFLPVSEFIVKEFPQEFLFDTCIVCDCSNIDRVEHVEKLKNVEHSYKLINIDHHPDNTCFGDINIVDTISSVGELLFRSFQYLKWEITVDMATCLYAAISFDTGRFAHSNVTSYTFAAVSSLVELGADSFSLSQAMDDNKTLNDFRLMKIAIENLVVDKQHGFAYTCIPKKSPNGSLKVVDIIRQLKDIDLFIVFQELQGRLVKVNLRSKLVANVSELAQKFGGGGHERAAGILFHSDLESCQMELIQYLRSR